MTLTGIDETLGTVCISPEELSIIINAAGARAYNFGVITLFIGLALGIIIGIGLHRLYVKGYL